MNLPKKIKYYQKYLVLGYSLKEMYQIFRMMNQDDLRQSYLVLRETILLHKSKHTGLYCTFFLVLEPLTLYLGIAFNF